jgi:preprotein translocase subunit YajC
MPKNLVPLIYLALLILAFYFLMVRPQRQRMRRADAMQSQLNVGDEVMLTSGIFGSIARIGDDGVHVTIADGVEIRVDRRAIGTVSNRSLDEADEADLEITDDSDEMAAADDDVDLDQPSAELDRPDKGAG